MDDKALSGVVLGVLSLVEALLYVGLEPCEVSGVYPKLVTSLFTFLYSGVYGYIQCKILPRGAWHLAGSVTKCWCHGHRCA